MAQYTSIHSGIDIDKAVSYFNSIQAYGRTILSVDVENTTDWKVRGNIADADTNNIYIKDGSESVFYIKIQLSGSYQLGGAPIVYFIDNEGQKWDLNYIYRGGTEEDPTRIICCYSNK